jgi:hypothetical protein
MNSKAVRLALFLLSIALFMVLPTGGQAVSTPSGRQFSPATTLSLSNQVPDFYVQGTSADYSIELSSKGGYVSSSAGTITYMPWGYVTAQWTIGQVYIVFLANVTSNNFYIGFLYLTNSSTPFILRSFEYNGAHTKDVTFNGIQYIFPRMVSTPSISVPTITFAPKPQSKNTLSVIGHELYVNGNSGQVVNGSETLNLYPLTNQLYSGPNDYNELWSLMTDDFGNYFFAILYMQNSNHHQVIMEHQIRLNDYQKLDGRGFDAVWGTGTFSHRATVKMPVGNSIVKVDGFPFDTDGSGLVSVYVPGDWLTIEVPNEISVGPNVILHFATWKGQGTSNPLNVTVGSGQLSFTAQYATENLLTIQSQFGGAQGAGWYNQGANATFSARTSIDLNNGTRRMFDHWSGDYSSTSNTGSIIMNSPKTIIANWQTQFAVKLQLDGIPPNSSSVTILVNGQPKMANASVAGEIWVDANSELNLDVQTTQIQTSTDTYNYTGLQVEGQPSSQTFIVTKPVTVTFVYSDRPKAQSVIVLNSNPASSIQGYPVTLSGSIEPSMSTIVDLYYGTDNLNWYSLANVTTDNTGKFTYTWIPDQTGDYYIRANYAGDALHAPAFATAPVRVQSVQLPIANALSNLFKNVTGIVKSVPFLSAVLALAQALLMLGVAIASLIFPSAPSFVGYFIGSILIGFVYIFPFSAILMSVKAAKSQHSPSPIWLTPLITIWIAALAMLIMGTSLFAAEPLLFEASAILLISSNTLLMPLAVSVVLAKAIAG